MQVVKALQGETTRRHGTNHELPNNSKFSGVTREVVKSCSPPPPTRLTVKAGRMYGEGEGGSPKPLSLSRFRLSLPSFFYVFWKAKVTTRTEPRRAELFGNWVTEGNAATAHDRQVSLPLSERGKCKFCFSTAMQASLARGSFGRRLAYHASTSTFSITVSLRGT